MIQTDASANLGNSGGPLLDGAGRIGGILSAKAIGIGVEGIAIAVPVERVAERLSLRFAEEPAAAR
jgi:S1-C subfamily serine protease